MALFLLLLYGSQYIKVVFPYENSSYIKVLLLLVVGLLAFFIAKFYFKNYYELENFRVMEYSNSGVRGLMEDAKKQSKKRMADST